MFVNQQPRTVLGSTARTLGLIYHNTVRIVRKKHGNALMALVMNFSQTLIMVAVFYIMMTLTGMRTVPIRGDFVVFLMTGIFLFMTHIKSMGAVASAEGPASPMMKHAPMNTVIAVASSALSALYIQLLTMIVILFLVHVAWHPVEIDRPIGVIGMVMLAWFTGATIGLVFYALRPWFPTAVPIINTLYSRANMIASGKMFVANALPTHILVYFDWNPLFHTIDQARGFAFVNYWPRYSSVSYPVKVGLALLMIGLIAEFYTRRNASLSWSAGR
ncbi:MAG: ABC transporter permease [Alphaproteobacteria bacterium]|nr:MAG: ABC transporter permease [Alphaproteobacteria bacterium]